MASKSQVGGLSPLFTWISETFLAAWFLKQIEGPFFGYYVEHSGIFI